MNLNELLGKLLAMRGTMSKRKGGRKCVKGDKLARAMSRAGNVYGRKVWL